MSKKGYFVLLIIALCTLPLTSLVAQTSDREWEDYDLEYRTFRFGVIPGLSTNGLNATRYASKYSLNLLVGYNGALANGFELGGLVNANKYYAHGVQIAGLANYSGENTAGIQFAGLANLSKTDMQGIQFAGLVNKSGSNSQGIQFGGILNVAQYDMQGLFVSGLGNITDNNMQGLFYSALFNIARANLQGIAVTGLFNYSETFQGISISSINTTEILQGIQIGGINIADGGQGLQIGLINYAKEFEGAPVGLISYYEDGRKNIDTWTNESGFTNVGLKLGTEPVYNMISIGYNPLVGRNVWQIGWSIGRLHEYENHTLYTDFSYFKVNEGNWTRDLNSILKYRVLFGKEFSSGIKLYGGPTFNMMISRVPESDDYTLYRIFDFEAKDRQYVFWLGASLGIELF